VPKSETREAEGRRQLAERCLLLLVVVVVAMIVVVAVAVIFILTVDGLLRDGNTQNNTPCSN
jgi:hypothetical protein